MNDNNCYREESKSRRFYYNKLYLYTKHHIAAFISKQWPLETHFISEPSQIIIFELPVLMDGNNG